MIRRVAFLFPVLLFVVIRQIYTNLLGIDRDILTALLCVGLAWLALLAFQLRMREMRRDLLPLDVINLVQFCLAGVTICVYFVAGHIESNQAIYAVFYYGLAPFLLYCGFVLARLKPVTQRAALVALGLTYLVTLLVAIFESLGIEFWLFQYDRWVLQKNYFGITRASGLYGTQIDYGLLSFLTFTVAFYSNAQRRHWFAKLIMAAATLGTLLSMSRAWVGAWAIVVLLHMMRAQSLKQKLKIAAVVVLVCVLLFSVADRLGFVAMLRATDPYTQESNEGRLAFYQNAPKWLHEFFFVGTGPGTQNGPDVHDIKFVSDFLWLATFVEFGTVLGFFLVLLKLFTIGFVLYRARASIPNGALRSIVRVGCITFLLASFVDSAYAHLVSISAFYVSSGLLLYDAGREPLAETDATPELQPA